MSRELILLPKARFEELTSVNNKVDTTNIDQEKTSNVGEAASEYSDNNHHKAGVSLKTEEFNSDKINMTEDDGWSNTPRVQMKPNTFSRRIQKSKPKWLKFTM